MKKRTPPRPRKKLTRPVVLPAELPKPQHIAVDVVVVGDEVMSGRERCLVCEAVFGGTDIALRIREFRLMVDYLIHRRCIEKVLASGPVGDEEFESYRAGLLAKYSP